MLGTREPFLVPLAAATVLLGTGSAQAQLDLPPPPPPPLGQPSDLPTLPPPPAPKTSAAPPSEPPRHAAAPPARTPRNRPAAPHPEMRARPAEEPEPAQRTLAVTWNPVDIAWGRLSANAELLLAPRHSLVACLDSLVFHADRGSSQDVLSEGFGFASPTSFGLGGELGYRYWPRGLTSLTGPFVGPSFVLGATTDARVGDPSHVQGYWGLAVDLGYQQQLLVDGFTAGAGVGLEVVHMADVTALVPRLLAQVGWSF